MLGDFAGASLSHAGTSSSLFRRAGAYVMRIDGPDGALHDYEVRYTLGVAPLQQYLVGFPGGRLQSPEIAGTLVKLGVDAKISSPEEFTAFLGAERDKWAAVIKAAGVRAE